MSNYKQLTKNPRTGEFEEAEWLDDYFGRHHYGVRFKDGTIYDTWKVELITFDDPEEFVKQAREAGVV